MGVTYKLRDEVVQFIISQRQSNPLFSCRQLAESASQKFGLNLSKSSVHDVLKESGIITPRGRKPKDKFEIPQDKKKQIQVSLSQVKLLAPPAEPQQSTFNSPPVILSEAKPASPAGGDLDSSSQNDKEETFTLPRENDMKNSPEYDGAGRIFFKAALWDLGIFSEEQINETDWAYYLTYSKGVKVVLENNKDFFIDLPLPLERCVREVADGLVNNVKPFILSKVTDEGLFKACMSAQKGFNIKNISIVGQKDHILLEFTDIMEFNRDFMIVNREYVENDEINFMKRTKIIFFAQHIDNNDVIDNILNLRGFDASKTGENVVNLLIKDGYESMPILQEAMNRLNGMYLRDEQDQLIKVSAMTRG